MIEIAATLLVGTCVEVKVHASALSDVEVERLRKVVAESDARGAWELLVRFKDDVAGGDFYIVFCCKCFYLSDVFDLSCKIHVFLF